MLEGLIALHFGEYNKSRRQAETIVTVMRLLELDWWRVLYQLTMLFLRDIWALGTTEFKGGPKLAPNVVRAASAELWGLHHWLEVANIYWTSQHANEEKEWVLSNYFLLLQKVLLETIDPKFDQRAALLQAASLCDKDSYWQLRGRELKFIFRERAFMEAWENWLKRIGNPNLRLADMQYSLLLGSRENQEINTWHYSEKVRISVGIGGPGQANFSEMQLDVLEWIRLEAEFCLRSKKKGLILHWDCYDGSRNLWMKIFFLLETVGAKLARAGKYLWSVGKADELTVYHFYQATMGSHLHLSKVARNPAKNSRDLGVVQVYSEASTCAETRAWEVLSEVRSFAWEQRKQMLSSKEDWPKRYLNLNPFERPSNVRDADIARAEQMGLTAAMAQERVCFGGKEDKAAEVLFNESMAAWDQAIEAAELEFGQI